MDPLYKVREAEEKGIIRKSLANRIERRMKYVKEGIERVERASSLSYPPYYIEPYLTFAATRLEIGQFGIMYARVLPKILKGEVKIFIELSAPLILYARKGTLHAVLGHEFLHYIELVRKLTSFDVLAEEKMHTLFESSYADMGRIIEPKLIFKDRALIRLINKRFPNGLVDEKLDTKVMKMWIEKNMPTRQISPDENVVRIPIHVILATKFDEKLRMRLDGISKLERSFN